MKRAVHITPETLTRWNALLDTLEWSDRRLADELGLDEQTPWTWRQGIAPIPLYAWRFLEAIAALKKAYEPYTPNISWRRNGRGNPKVRDRMDAQALQRFKDAGKL